MSARIPTAWLGVLLLALSSQTAVSPAQEQEMVLLRGGEFMMGTDNGFPYEGPSHRVKVKPFWIDRTEVTNRAFQKFVKATGYVTEAERLGWSGVFDPAAKSWVGAKGANWQRPEGPGSSIKDRPNHPVVHVSWSDAQAYAHWADKRLPTEAEWEFAARAGLADAEYAWGNELAPKGRFRANTWQGTFPAHDEGSDGHASPAPVQSYPANGYGLYDMAGNVWEWTEDWYAADYYEHSDSATDPRGPKSGTEKVIRGGSWLCAENYCTGYRVAARQKSPPDSGLNNLGFRCAR